jgi:hypothetical protein
LAGLVPQEPEDDIEAVLGRTALRLHGVERRSEVGSSPEEPTCCSSLDGDDGKGVRDSVVQLPCDPHPFVPNRQLGALALFHLLVLSQLFAKRSANRHAVAEHPRCPEAENACDAGREVVASR